MNNPNKRKQILILGHNDATQFLDIYNQYTRLFDTRQYEVTVATLTGKDQPTTRARLLAENIIFLDLPKKRLRYLKIGAIRQLLALTREKNFEIVICHRYKPSYMMLWVARFHRIPALVCVMHELNTLSSFSRQCIVAALGRKRTLFAGVSNAVRDDLRKKIWGIPQQHMMTLYNVIDVPLVEPQFLTKERARKALNISEDAFLFGNIARLAPNKDQATLIHAFSRIKSHCPNTKLILIGEGELEKTLQQQVKAHGLTEDVIFTGFLPQAYQYMRAFDCFVLSSIQEAFGRVLIEAMLAYVPVIATGVHGIPEVLGDTNQLVKPQDAEALSEAMNQVYFSAADAREDQVNKAYQRVTKQFSITAFKQQFFELPVIKPVVVTHLR